MIRTLKKCWSTKESKKGSDGVSGRAKHEYSSYDDGRITDSVDCDIDYVPLPGNPTPHMSFTSSLPAPTYLSHQWSYFLQRQTRGRTDTEWRENVQALVVDADMG